MLLNLRYSISAIAQALMSRLTVCSLLCWILQEDVDSFMKQPGNETADAALRKLDEQYQKYKYMELNLSQKKLR